MQGKLAWVVCDISTRHLHESGRTTADFAICTGYPSIVIQPSRLYCCAARVHRFVNWNTYPQHNTSIRRVMFNSFAIKDSDYSTPIFIGRTLSLEHCSSLCVISPNCWVFQVTVKDLWLWHLTRVLYVFLLIEEFKHVNQINIT